MPVSGRRHRRPPAGWCRRRCLARQARAAADPARPAADDRRAEGVRAKLGQAEHDGAAVNAGERVGVAQPGSPTTSQASSPTRHLAALTTTTPNADSSLQPSTTPANEDTTTQGTDRQQPNVSPFRQITTSLELGSSARWSTVPVRRSSTGAWSRRGGRRLPATRGRRGGARGRGARRARLGRLVSVVPSEPDERDLSQN
jgi:hypothetical protein